MESSRRVFALSAFIWAGESIYLLPYTLRRDYSGTLIEVLQLPDEAALGAIYSIFGVLCLGAYVAGGWLADRVSPRILLPFSLTLTAVGGGILATFPSPPVVLYSLFALWAFSTILTFWAALIKATRAWGIETWRRVADLTFSKFDDSYDRGIAETLRHGGIAIDDSPFELGEVSFHHTRSLHTAGPNRSNLARMALATTYLEDGARLVDSPTLVSGDFEKFMPGVRPGDPIASRLNPVVYQRVAAS